MNIFHNKLYQFVNKAAIYVFSVYRIAVKKFFLKKEKRNTKEIIIILAAGIGDGLLFLDGIKKLRNHYPQKEGYHIRFISTETDIMLYKEHGCCGLDEYISIGCGKYISFPNFLRIYRRLNQYKPEIVLVYNVLWYRVLMAACIDSEKSYCLKLTKDIYKSMLLKRIFPYAFSDIVYWEQNKMFYEAVRDVMRMMGVNDYKTEIGRLENVRKLNGKKRKILGIIGEYCIVVPGASETGRRWESEKFIVCIRHILNTYGISVLIMGALDEKYIGEKIKQYFHEDDRVVDLTGRTSLEDMLSIVADSKFVLGNDTGTIHAAASLGVPSVCLMSYKEIGAFQPYTVDSIRKDDKMPIGIWTKDVPECKGCGIYSKLPRRKMVCGNEKCVDNICHGKPFECLSRIPAEDVVKKIDALLKGKM